MHQQTLKASKRISIGILIILSFFINTRYAQSGQSNTQILSYKGNVEVRRGNTVSWIKAKKGLQLQPGDIVRTGAKSLAVILHESAKVQLYENTTLELPARTKGQQVSTEDQGLQTMIMEKGHALFHVFKDRIKRRFEVITPSLIAGVKGTIFKVYEEKHLKGVAVSEGLVEVINQEDLAEIVEISANQFTLWQDEHLSQAKELNDDNPMTWSSKNGHFS